MLFPPNFSNDDEVHWHAYAEVRTDNPSSTRDERLTRSPDTVLWSTDSVALWIGETAR